MIEFAEVDIGTGVPSPCVRCTGGGPEARPHPASSIADEIARVAADWLRGPGPNVSFTGFEPFSHPELPAIVGAAAENGFERIRLSTDAGALAHGGNAAGVIGAGVRQLEVIVLGDDGVHDELCGCPGLLGAARAGVAAFMAAAAAQGVLVTVSGRVPVCAHNARHLPDAVAALAEMGAVFVSVVPLVDEIDPDVVAIAEQTAVTAGAWLHVPGVSSLSAPVTVFEARA